MHYVDIPVPVNTRDDHRKLTHEPHYLTVSV